MHTLLVITETLRNKTHNVVYNGFSGHKIRQSFGSLLSMCNNISKLYPVDKVLRTEEREQIAWHYMNRLGLVMSAINKTWL